ncbi:MAG TPA: MotA/TolQ/ExbB proton channel family protein [Planctomycetota bacterium]|nr:MotA/TolQ/ExbB proton channel family protein [Planctomycetota bacterium]
MDQSLWTLISKTISESGSIEQAVFFLLVALSLISWTIVLMKLLDFKAARRNGEKFAELFESADNFGAVMTGAHTVGPSPQLEIFKAAMHSLESRRVSNNASSVRDPRQIQLRPESTPEDMLVLDMQNAANFDFERLRRGLPFLATIGSTSPFIGLFGTVWGIMDTFRALNSATSVTLNMVAPGISSALIATAAGLAVAIPAVMAYNYYLTRLNRMHDNADSFIQRVKVLVAASQILRQAPATPTNVNAVSSTHVTATPTGVQAQAAGVPVRAN